VLTERSDRVRSACRLIRRSARARAGLFLAEGRQAVTEALTETERTRPGLVRELFVELGAAGHRDLVDRATYAGVLVREAEPAAMAALSETVSPQGIVAVCQLPDVSPAAVLDHSSLAALLVEVQDPGNAGTIIRCADAAGAGGVLLTEGSVDPHGGKAVRASAGSVFHLPISTGLALPDVLTRARKQGLTVLAAHGSGADVDLDEAGDSGLLTRPALWLFGNESRGLPPKVRDVADEVVAIPMYGRAESLNLATAAAVCLYASARAHRVAPARARRQ